MQSSTKYKSSAALEDFLVASGIACVLQADEKIYINAVRKSSIEDYSIKIGHVVYTFVEAGTNPLEDYPFDLSNIIEKVFVDDFDDASERRIAVLLNELADWALVGGDTIQIRIEQREPLSIEFRNKLIAVQKDNPLFFHSKIAIHRGSAELLVTFVDLTTHEKQTHVVAFDERYRGGLRYEQYQDVCLRLPPGHCQVETSIAIRFTRYIDDDGSGDVPFIFISNPRVAVHNRTESAYIVGDAKPSTANKWLVARTPSSFTGDKIFRICSTAGECLVIPKLLKEMAAFFDEPYYISTNEDVSFADISPLEHYVEIGWRESRNPGPEFSVREYLSRHGDVERSGMEPLLHYASQGKAENRSLGVFGEILNEIWQRSGSSMPALDPSVVFARAQDLMLPMEIINTRRLIVMIVPEHDAMSGGIYSIFSIAGVMRRLRHKSGFEVIMMTRPNRQHLTYLRNSSFSNSETVYRIEQLRLFTNVSELQLHIPEYATVDFIRSLSSDLLNYLLRRDKVHVNILNQNIRLMPSKEKFRDLRRIATSIGQSVAHHAYAGPRFADTYDLPTILLPAYTDLTLYPGSDFDKKDNLIIYSNDDAKYRFAVLLELEKLSEFRLVKIAGMTFDRYMDLATRCKFSLSFGEGFDGYVAQPIYQGGIGFALYNEEFFPDPSFRHFENFFETASDMIAGIVPTIRRLASDKHAYETLNRQLKAKWEALYSIDDYENRIDKLVRREYEVFPSSKD